MATSRSVAVAVAPWVGQGLRFVLEHLGLIDLEDDGAGRPLEAVSAGIETGRQDHHLSDSGVGGVGEERVEEVRSHRLIAEHVLEDCGGLRVGSLDPLGHGLVDEGLPHSGPGTVDQNAGERIDDQRVGALGLPGPGGGHHHRRRSHTCRDIPGVVITAQIAHRSRAACAGSSWPGRCRAGTAGPGRVWPAWTARPGDD